MKLFLLFLLSWCVACSRVPNLVDRDYTAYETLSERKADLLWEELATQGAAITSGRLELEAVAKKGLHQEQAKQIVLFERPENLRVEILATALNQLAVLVVANPDGIFAYDAKEKKYYRGEASLKNTSTLLSVPFLPEELMMWLSGQVFVPAAIQERTISISADKSRYLVAVKLWDGRIFQYVMSRTEPPRVNSLEIFDAEKKTLLFSSTFDYDENASVPKKLHFTAPGQRIEGNLSYVNAAHNPDFSTRAARLFSLPIPEGALVVSLDQ